MDSRQGQEMTIVLVVVVLEPSAFVVVRTLTTVDDKAIERAVLFVDAGTSKMIVEHGSVSVVVVTKVEP